MKTVKVICKVELTRSVPDDTSENDIRETIWDGFLTYIPVENQKLVDLQIHEAEIIS